MAEVFVSPGVYTQESEILSTPAVGGTDGGSVVGLTQKGPAFLPIEVTSFNEFKSIFGNPKEDLYAPYAAKSYLRNASSLNVVRVLGRNTANVGGSIVLSFPVAGVTEAALSASNVVLGVLRFRGDHEVANISGSPTNFSIAIPGKGVTATNLSLLQSSASYIKKVIGTDPKSVKSGDTLTAVYVDAVFDYKVSSVTGTVSGAAANATFALASVDNETIAGGFQPARSTTIVSQNFGGTVYDLFDIYSRSDGDASNQDVKISISQVDLTSTASPKFSIVVRAINDTDEDPVVLESFTDLNLDASSKKYIGRVIGDRYPVYDLTQSPPEILFDGDYPNKSYYIRVKIHDGFPGNARPCGFKGYEKIGYASNIPEVPIITDQLNARNEVDNRKFMGVQFVGGLFDRLKPTITSSSATTSADTGFLLMSSTSDLSGSAMLTGYNIINMVGSNSGNFSANNKIRFSFPLYKGFDGLDPRLDRRVSVNDGTLSADFNVALQTLANPDEIDTNLIVVPGVHSSSVGNVPQMLIDVASRRGDAFTIIDISKGTATADAINMSVDEAIIESLKYDTNYSATYYPWIKINDADNDKLVWVPPSVEVMGAYAFNDRVGQPWLAPAGFTRGGLESVVEARRRLTQGQRDNLYAANINPIATFPGIGIVIWGQKTLYKKDSVLDRVNVRRMLLTVRKSIARMTRVFNFEQGAQTLISNIRDIINSYLQTVQRDNGITNMRVIIDETTTTPDLLERNIVKGKIMIQPTTAVEVILLDFAVTPNGSVFED